MIGEAAEVAGAGKGAEGLKSGEAGVAGGEVRRGEDVFAGLEAFQYGAAVDFLPTALEFDCARPFRICRRHARGWSYLIVEVPYCDYPGDAFGQK